ncbi:MAG: diguanylate cyclase [Planctomycetes bacterium]|nr:diguanylate cyclase [Planctomycetota bacterium]
MTAANALNPNRRGNAEPRTAVLVVGDDELLQAVRAAVGEAGVERVEHFLMAIGHLAASPASVIVGRASVLRDAAASTARALRRLSPGARLVLVAEAEDEPEARKAVRAGFDAYVVEPIDTAELALAMRTTTPTAPASTPASPQAPVMKPAAPTKPTSAPPPVYSPPTPIAHLSLDTKPAAPAAPLPIQLDERAGLEDEPPINEYAHGEEQPAPQTPPTGTDAYDLDILFGSHFPPSPSLVADADLGDVDLVDQLLMDRRGLRDLAMRMVASRSGLVGVGWSERAESIPTGRVVATVEHRGRALGYLHAEAVASEDSLRSWASWLGHWLAMDQRMGELWAASYKDELTGVWNRRYFNRFLETVLSRARAERFAVTVMMFDIDDFKLYNDRYGHSAGDEILREASRLMCSVVRDHDIVARIGGDEFAVIFWDAGGPRRPNSSHPTDVSLAAKRFRKAISEHRFPKLADEAPGVLTISGGLASFPWDGQTPDALLEVADRMAIQSKRQGKNVVTLGPGAAQASLMDNAPQD